MRKEKNPSKRFLKRGRRMIEVLLIFILIFLILTFVLMISILWNIVDLGVDIRTDISLILTGIRRIDKKFYNFKEQDDCK